jgi:hypothetical protein
MSDLRRLVVEGRNYDECQQILGLSKRTFYRYLAKLFEEDKRLLTEQNHDELLRQTSILLQRYTKILQALESMAEDQNITATERLAVLSAQMQVSRSILNVYRDAPALSIVQQRKLQGLQHGFLRFDDMQAHIPPSLPEWWVGRAYPPDSREPEQEQEQEQEQEGEEPAYDHEQ